MNINDKIKQILIDKNLSPSYFADEIGVQRSSISHILSGRNRPSFDIIQKIIRRFPELGYDWIMEEDVSTNQSGYGNRGYNRASNERLPSSNPSSNTFSVQPSVRSQRNEIPPLTDSPQPVIEPINFQEPLMPTQTSNKKVERILIFYTDGSFREYTPSSV